MATAEVLGTRADDRVLPKRSTWGLIQLALFWVAANFHWVIIPTVILPQQVQALLYANHPAGLSGDALNHYVETSAPGALAFVVGPGLLMALISNPLFGYLSDRTRLRWGRRRPYILAGTIVNVGGLIFMASAPNLFVLTGALMVVQLANNAAAAPFHALLPDLVPPEQRGRASGIMGIGQMAGTIIGAIVPGIFFSITVTSLIAGTQSFASYQQNLYAIYGFAGAFILVLALLTAIFVKERPFTERADMPTAEGVVKQPTLTRDLLLTIGGIIAATVATGFVLNLAGIDFINDEHFANLLPFPALIIGSIGVAKAFDFRPRANPDFAWVLVTRAIMVMGIYTVFGFMQLYLQNVVYAGDADTKKSAVSGVGAFLAIVIGTAAISTGFAGYLSDRFGRKRMVYVSGALMALVGLIFVVTALISSDLSIATLYPCAALFGLGYGSYVSVDWALVTDVLPSEDNFARDMGVWNVALTAPQVLAYIFGALAISLFNEGGVLPVAGYPKFGWTVLFILLTIYAAIGTVTVRYIRGIKR